MAKRKMRKKLKEVLDLPAEIVMNAPRVVLDSNLNVLIENYKGIIEYSDAFVRVNTSEFTIKVEGRNLAIDFITLEDLSISGEIHSVIYD